MKIKYLMLGMLLIAAFCVPVEHLSAQYQINGWVFSAGGGDAGGDGKALRSTAGQPLAGAQYGDVFVVRSGFWYLAGSSFVTSVDYPDGEIPYQYTLMQNYPNPFNPSTTIRFALPAADEVRMVAYDLLGREVAILIDEHKAAGYHDVVFDAQRLSSGVYIYQIRAGEFMDTKRLILIK